MQVTQQAVFPLLTYEMNSDVRAEASNTLPELINVLKKHGGNQIGTLHDTAKLYVSEIIGALEKEEDNSTVATFLDNLGGIVEKVGLFLSANELNILFGKLLAVFDKVETYRLNLLNKKKTVEFELESDKVNGNDKIYSDDENDDEEDVVGEIENDIGEIEEVLVSIADVIGSLFSTHKDLTLEIVGKLLQEYLPKYFKDTSSNFERRWDYLF